MTYETVTFQMLNDDCLLRIFKSLEFDDQISLAETCRHLKYVASTMLMFKQFSQFKIDLNWINRKGQVYIERIVPYIGRHISSLEVDFQWMDQTWTHTFLKTISDYVGHLKSLKIKNWHQKSVRLLPAFYYFDNVELLTLYRCSGLEMCLLDEFGQNFGKLKFLNFHYCENVGFNDLRTWYEHNPNIESLTLPHYTHGFKLFHLVTRLKRLRMSASSTMELSSLIELNHLTSLQLDCNMNDCDSVNDFLRQLAKKGMIIELDLQCLEVNADTYEIWRSFEKLELMVIRCRNVITLNSPLSWPKNLKFLSLHKFKLTFNAIASIIKEIPEIQKIDISQCTGFYFDKQKKSNQPNDSAKKYTIDSVRRTISERNSNHIKVLEDDESWEDINEQIMYISFPGICYSNLFPNL